MVRTQKPSPKHHMVWRIPVRVISYSKLSLEELAYINFGKNFFFSIMPAYSKSIGEIRCYRGQLSLWQSILRNYRSVTQRMIYYLKIHYYILVTYFFQFLKVLFNRNRRIEERNVIKAPDKDLFSNIS